MERTWTTDRMHQALREARAFARKNVRLVTINREVSPHYAFACDELTIVLNPVVTGYLYVPKSKCPVWLKQYIEGRRYSATGETNTIHSQQFQQAQAYGVIEAAIIRRMGFNGHIQGELPF
jgi:hypothetical protein